MEYKFTKDNKKVAVINQLNSTQVIVQDVYCPKDDESKMILGGEPYAYNSANLFDEPVKPSEWRWLQQDKDAWNKERQELRSKIEWERAQATTQLKRLKGLSKWLSNVSKEPQEEKVKEIVQMLSALYSTDKKWFVDFSSWLQPKVSEINSIADDNIISTFVDEGGDVRLMSINIGTRVSDVYMCLSSYSDGSGKKMKFAIVDNEQTLHNLLQDWLDKKSSYSISDINYAKSHSLSLDMEKAKQTFTNFLDSRKKDYDKYTEYLQVCQQDIQQREKDLEELNK